jgi:hypothetical protein
MLNVELEEVNSAASATEWQSDRINRNILKY